MRGKTVIALLFLLVFAVSRIPGLLPPNFSVAYAFAFCAGVYLAGARSWWLGLGSIVLTDVLVNCHYQFVQGLQVWTTAGLKFMLINYAAFSVLILLGKRFKPGDSWTALLGGGLLGAMLFYLITNTAAWLFNPFGNPEYTRDLWGWIRALTIGTAGWPETWVFFRNTLLSGGLFTGLFVGAAKAVEALQTEEEPEQAAAEDTAEAEPAPEEAGG